MVLVYSTGDYAWSSKQKNSSQSQSMNTKPWMKMYFNEIEGISMIVHD